MEWWIVGNFHPHRFCLAFFTGFSRSAMHSNKAEPFRKIQVRWLWSVGKAASCQQFSVCDSELLMGPRHSLWIQSLFFLRTQVWWSSPNQNWSSKLCPWIDECHFGLKKMSNTPQMRQILWQTRRVALFLNHLLYTVYTSNYRQPEFLRDYQLPPLSAPEQTPPNPNAWRKAL